MVDNTLIEMLRCPACEDRPRVETAGDKLKCSECGREYEIVNGIPVMIVEEAEDR